MARVVKSLVGKKFGRLFVRELLYNRDKKGKSIVWYDCLCDCGKSHITRAISLRGGSVKSCGCLKKDAESKLKLIDRREKIMRRLYTINRYKNKCRKGIENISYEDFKKFIVKPCHYCGSIDSNCVKDIGKKGKKYSEITVRYNGLDRINSNKGYSYFNVVPCCRTCNVAKSDLILSQFKIWVKRIYNHMYNKSDELDKFFT